MRLLASLAALWRTPVDESLAVFRALDASRRPGTMVDVGAHFGGSLTRFARAGWRVLAFEPDPENRARLAATCEGLENVAIDRRGLSDAPQQRALLYRSAQSTGISTLSPFHASHRADGEVELTTIEAVSREHRLEGIDYLKVDTEGFDLLVLKGVPWERFAPRIILCEFEDAKTQKLGYDYHDLAGFLARQGYKLVVSEWFPIERYGARHRWRRFAVYPCDLEDPLGWGNLIAARDDADYRALLRECRLTAAA